MRVATLQTYVVCMISRNEIGDPFEDTFGKKNEIQNAHVATYQIMSWHGFIIEISIR
jgi:hypothetical protein